jgi:hypothetical protein
MIISSFRKHDITTQPMLRICGYLSDKPGILNLLMLFANNILLQSSRKPLLSSPMKRTSSAGSPPQLTNATQNLVKPVSKLFLILVLPSQRRQMTRHSPCLIKYGNTKTFLWCLWKLRKEKIFNNLDGGPTK